jgi:hypothetical protein
VRPSTQFYLRFSLPMVSSLGFGSNSADKFGLLTLAFTMAVPNGFAKPTKLTRWIVLQKARRHRINLLRLLVRTQFQALFHSPIRGSFNLSLTVLVHYRSQDIFSLGGWTPQIQSGFHVSRPTRHRAPDYSSSRTIDKVCVA